MPPTIGFIFDREARSDSEVADITRQSGGGVSFLPTRMYENYLLDADAVFAVLSDLNVKVTADHLAAELRVRLADPLYYAGRDVTKAAGIDGAKVLRDVFSAASGDTLQYAKIRDGIALTQWLLRYRHGALQPVADLLRSRLEGRSGGIGGAPPQPPPPQRLPGRLC